MYAIFINNTVIYLVEKPQELTEIIAKKYESDNFLSVVKKLLNEDKATKLCFFHHNVDELWKNFKSQFKIIVAAGGVVFNEKQEVLWIYRNNIWDLPKGKIDEGETKEIAAIREVKEECGIKNVLLKEFLMTTYHIYKYKEKVILKVTYWYKMVSNSNEELIPQLEEGITKIEWKNLKESGLIAEQSFGNIKKMIKFVKKIKLG